MYRRFIGDPGEWHVMIGISTFSLHKLPLVEALDEISKLTDLVEVMDDGLHHIDSAELLESYTMRFALHAPARGVNIASLLEPIRKASVEVTGECFRVAAEVDACVVVHPGYFAWSEERAPALAQTQRSLRELASIAEEYSVRFCVENMGNWDYFFLRSPDELPLFDGAGFALDVGHAYLNHCLEEFLALHMDHIHLHDNAGTSDSHLPVGEGTIDFRPVMQAVRRTRATAIVEVDCFEGAVASMKLLERM